MVQTRTMCQALHSRACGHGQDRSSRNGRSHWAPSRRVGHLPKILKASLQRARLLALIAPPRKAVALLCRRLSLLAAGWKIAYHSSTFLPAASEDGKGGTHDPLDAAVRPVVDDRAPDDQPRLDDDGE